MFEPHKGHIVCKIEDAANELRNKMDDAAKQGFTKKMTNQKLVF